MPEEPTTTSLIHYRGDGLGTNACTAPDWEGFRSWNPGEVTCFACRNTPHFKQAQREWNPGWNPGEVTCSACRNTPQFKQAQRDPVQIGEILRDLPLINQGVEPPTPEFNLDSMRNERKMFVIEEVIHYGQYYSTRRVEVYDLNPVTVNALIMSSAYAYGDWLHPEPRHEARRTHLYQLVEDLRNGRENRAVGWSTFRLINPTQ